MSLAHEVLAEALRAHDEYRSRLLRLVYQRTDEELDFLLGKFGATNGEMPAASWLVSADIRIACNRAKKDRTAWAEAEKEIGS